MLKLKKIAITGGIASGKTSVCQFFKELGAYVVSADAIAHELLNPHTDLGQELLRNFGPEIFENGQINRQVLARKVFEDKRLLKQLEELLHPAVFAEIEKQYSKALKGSYTSFVAEIPLLFEVGREKDYDVTIAVLSNEAEAKKRFQKTEYDLRMKRQLDPKQKAERADYTIHNTGSLEDLRDKVIKLNQIIHNP